MVRSPSKWSILRVAPTNRLATPPVAYGFVVLLIALGVFLPLFGASALLVLTAETLILSRLPGVRNWLGLRS